ncbi:MAG: helix-turn-helix domain-containing protein [Chloroflexota bacterium]
MEEPKKKMDKIATARPLRPILGGTKNGTRPQRYSYWRVGYAAHIPPTLQFWVSQAGEYHSDKPFVSGDFEHTQRYQFYYHLAGAAEIAHENGRFILNPGDLVTIPHKTKFLLTAPKGLRVHWFALEGQFVHFADGAHAVQRFSLGLQPSIETIFVLLRETLIFAQPGSGLKAVALVYELLALIELLQAPPQAQTIYPDAVRVALSHMREYYFEPFVAEEVAAVCGISAPHLRFLFQKWVGESPQQCHTRLRIEMAQRLLLTQSLTVGEVAKEVGYADPLYFSRVFKKLTGLRPSQFWAAQVAEKSSSQC